MKHAAVTALVGCVFCAAVPAAIGGGSRDLADTWLVEADAVGADRAPGWQVALAAGRLFSVPELAQKGLAARLTRERWRAGVSWERLGDDIYVEDMLRMQVGLGQRWSLGIDGGIDRLALAEASARTWPAAALRASTPVGHGLRLEIWSHLREPPPWYGRKGLRRLASLSGRHEGWAWVVAVDRSVDGYPSVQAEVVARVAPIVCLGVRGDPWSGAIGLSTTWRVGVGWLRTSHLVHPDLGTTHRWALVLGAGTHQEAQIKEAP